jgi:hypothetical protein
LWVEYVTRHILISKDQIKYHMLLFLWKISYERDVFLQHGRYNSHQLTYI